MSIVIPNEVKDLETSTKIMIGPFKIRTYGKGELAQLYCPNITTAAARKKLNLWISLYPNLTDALRRAGLSDASRSYTPAQVKLIVDALGEP